MKWWERIKVHCIFSLPHKANPCSLPSIFHILHPSFQLQSSFMFSSYIWWRLSLLLCWVSLLFSLFGGGKLFMFASFRHCLMSIYCFPICVSLICWTWLYRWDKIQLYAFILYRQILGFWDYFWSNLGYWFLLILQNRT